MNKINILLSPKKIFKKIMNLKDSYKTQSINNVLECNFVINNFLKLNPPNELNDEWSWIIQDICNEVNNAPRSFLRRPTISRTIHPDQQDLAKVYFEELMQDSFFVQNILPKLSDPPMGDPFRCAFFPFVSPISVQHVYYLCLLRKTIGVFLPEDVSYILEIGGGYGNLFRLLNAYGYEGRHCIADLPQMLDLQKHFLSNILSTKDLARINFSALDMDKILPSENDTSILIGTFSISEMPWSERQKIEAYYKRFNYLFIGHNSSFDGVNNIDYFDNLRVQLEDFFELCLLKDKYRPAYFLIGKRKGQ